MASFQSLPTRKRSSMFNVDFVSRDRQASKTRRSAFLPPAVGPEVSFSRHDFSR